ncbi:MAG: urease accessory protein UreD [Rhodobacter sp.]|nr:urease accessory protein UreD [Rhodobacter sp.]
MYDADPAPILQRARGRASVALSLTGGRTRLDRLHQAGSAKAFLPRVHGAAPEVVFLNTAGGLTGGDRFRFGLDVGPGAAAVATTQTAERAYASAGGVAGMEVALTVGTGGALDWLPQETILFDRSGLRRRTEIALAGDARLLWSEIVVLGRSAMGERVETLDFFDRRMVTRDGVPVMIEPLRIDGAVLARRDGAAVLGGARALATVALVAPGAEGAAGRVRDVAPGVVQAAASGWDGKCVVRALAGDAFELKRYVARVLAVLRPGPLPRVWQI